MPPTEDGVTLGEVGRRLDKLESRLEAGIASVGRQIQELQFVHRDTYDVQYRAHEDRIHDLENRAQWWGRAFVTSLILPVLVALILAVVLTR